MPIIRFERGNKPCMWPIFQGRREAAGTAKFLIVFSPYEISKIFIEDLYYASLDLMKLNCTPNFCFMKNLNFSSLNIFDLAILLLICEVQLVINCISITCWFIPNSIYYAKKFFFKTKYMWSIQLINYFNFFICQIQIYVLGPKYMWSFICEVETNN